MRIFKQLAKKDMDFSKKLMISYSLLLLLVLFIGLYLYNMSSRNLRSSVEDQTKVQLDTAFIRLQDDFDSMLNLSLSISKDSDISRLARMSADGSNNFYNSAYYAQQSLASYAPTQRLLPVTSYYIYFSGSDYILSPASFAAAHMYYKSANLSENSYGRWHDTLTDSSQYRKLIPMEQFGASSGDYLYILPLDTYLLYEMPASLCLVVDRDKMVQNFAHLTLEDEGTLFGVLPDSSDLLSVGKELTSVTADFLLSLDFQNYTAHCTIGGERYSVLRTDPSTNGYVCYYALPYSSIQRNLAQFRNMFLVVICAGLLVGFLLLFFLSRHNVRPYLVMDSQLRDTLSRAQQLQNTLDLQQPVVHSSYIRSLMLGRISSADELKYIQNYLGLDDTGRIYCVLYIVTYPDDQSAAEADLPEYTDESGGFTYDSALSYDAYVLACLKEHFGENINLFTPKNHTYALLISQEDRGDNDASANEIITAFQSFHRDVLERYAIWSIGGIGNYNRLPENLWKSYHQAVESVSYASSQNFICRYLSLKLSPDQYYFPSQLSESLANFITSGNKNQVAETFKFISTENLQKRSLSAPKMQCLLMEIYNTLSRVRYSISDDEAGEELRAADRRLNDYLSLRQLEDAAGKLCAFFSGRTSQHQTIGNIKSYIQKNYRDSSLCLSKLSDEFHLSESYLSYLFKESTGENFSMYLEHIRMEAALRLVRETSAPLSDLYLETGYNNANSFRRVFKKTYGMSAKAMRDSLNA